MKRAQTHPQEIRIYSKDGELVVCVTLKVINDVGNVEYVSSSYIASEQRTHSILEFFKTDIQIVEHEQGLYG